MTSRSASADNNEEKKKALTQKKQAYVPPTIMEAQPAKVMEYDWFKICAEDLLKYMKRT